MSWRREVVLICDWCADEWFGMAETTVAGARKNAQEDGWTTFQGADICDQCLAAEEARLNPPEPSVPQRAIPRQAATS